jgi:hypothetical protein
MLCIRIKIYTAQFSIIKNIHQKNIPEYIFPSCNNFKETTMSTPKSRPTSRPSSRPTSFVGTSKVTPSTALSNTSLSGSHAPLKQALTNVSTKYLKSPSTENLAAVASGGASQTQTHTTNPHSEIASTGRPESARQGRPLTSKKVSELMESGSSSGHGSGSSSNGPKTGRMGEIMGSIKNALSSRNSSRQGSASSLASSHDDPQSPKYCTTQSLIVLYFC